MVDRKYTSYTATLARNIEVEDTATVNVKWRNGALGSINVTMLTYPKNYEGSVTILGEKGTVEIGGLALNEVKHWEFETPWDVDRTISEASYKTDSVYGIGHPLYYRNVIDVMRGANVPSTDGREGYDRATLPPFTVLRNGWGYCPLIIKMAVKSSNFRDASIVEVEHQLARTLKFALDHVSPGAKIGQGCSLGQIFSRK